jgi:hypothetical protein
MTLELRREVLVVTVVEIVWVLCMQMEFFVKKYQPLQGAAHQQKG